MLRAFVLFHFLHNVLMCKAIWCFVGIILIINVLECIYLRLSRVREVLLGVLEYLSKVVTRVVESLLIYNEF